MTRAEAINKLNSIDGNEGNHVLLKKLEVLGLIKFEEEKIIDSPSMVIRDNLVDLVNLPMQKADQLINALMKAGYKIVRKGD